jgi:hypothetical protein
MDWAKDIWPRRGIASLIQNPLHRSQASLQYHCRSPSLGGPSCQDTGQLIIGPFYFRSWQACCTVQLPQKESLEVDTVASLTFGFGHLASSGLFSQSMLRNLSQSIVGPRCSWLSGTPYTYNVLLLDITNLCTHLRLNNSGAVLLHSIFVWMVVFKCSRESRAFQKHDWIVNDVEELSMTRWWDKKVKWHHHKHWINHPFG